MLLANAYSENPRVITPEAQARLKADLEALGDLGGIVHDLNTNQIVGGHQRLTIMFGESAGQFSISSANIEITKKYKKPTKKGTVGVGFLIWQDERFNYRQVRYTPAQFERANIVANLSGGQWDFVKLAAIDQNRLTGYGFTLNELRIGGLKLDGTPHDDAHAQVLMDEAKKLLKKWGVKPGDVWGLGDHRLLCGDCTNPGMVAFLLAGEVPGMMVTDPPYGVEYDPEWRDRSVGQFVARVKMRGKVEADHKNDWREAWALFPGDIVYIWHAALKSRQVFESVEACKFDIRAQIIWRKPSITISRGHYHFQHEDCLYAVRKGKQAKWRGGRKQSTVWDIAGMNPAGHTTKEDDKKTAHSTQKPVECFMRPLANHNVPVVYDPFCGSGTSIIAAQRLDRRCFALEINPAYIAVDLQRYYDAFGVMPVLLDRFKPSKS